MNPAGSTALEYQRARFKALLPKGYLYTQSHLWLAPQGAGAPPQTPRPAEASLWRVGLTSFAVRLLGETVEHGFHLEPGAPVSPGQAIGWVEGFKALSEVLCPAEGRFTGGNPALQTDITLINQDPHAAGWLYAVHGRPGAHCVDAEGYARILDQAIDRMLDEPKC